MCGQKLQLLLVGGTLPLIRRKPGWVCRAILIAKFFQRFGVNLNFAAWRTQRIFHRIGAEISITNVLFVLLAAAHFDQFILLPEGIKHRHSHALRTGTFLSGIIEKFQPRHFIFTFGIDLFSARFQ